MILAFFYLRGKWLLNWPIIYSGLVVFRPPPGSAAKCRGSLRNKKTPPMGEALTSPHKRGYPLANLVPESQNLQSRKKTDFLFFFLANADIPW